MYIGVDVWFFLILRAVLDIACKYSLFFREPYYDFPCLRFSPFSLSLLASDKYTTIIHIHTHTTIRIHCVYSELNYIPQTVLNLWVRRVSPEVRFLSREEKKLEGVLS